MDFLAVLPGISELCISSLMLLSFLLPNMYWSQFYKKIEYDSYVDQIRNVQIDLNLSPFHLKNSMTNGQDIAFYEEYEYTFCNKEGTPFFFYQKPEHYCFLLLCIDIGCIIALVISCVTLLSNVGFLLNLKNDSTTSKTQTKANLFEMKTTTNMITGIAGLFAIYNWIFLKDELARDYLMQYENLQLNSLQFQYGIGFYFFTIASALAIVNSFYYFFSTICILQPNLNNDNTTTMMKKKEKNQHEFEEGIVPVEKGGEFKDDGFHQNVDTRV